MVNAIDYSDKDDLLISGSADKSIKLWDCKNQGIIIDRKQSHRSRIVQI